MKRFLLILLLMTWGCSSVEEDAAAKATYDRFVEHNRLQVAECQALGGFAHTRWEVVHLSVEGYLRVVTVSNFLFQRCAFPPSVAQMPQPEAL
jgi:hypothetical protein